MTVLLKYWDEDLQSTTSTYSLTYLIVHDHQLSGIGTAHSALLPVLLDMYSPSCMHGMPFL
jgi:hypothetical protein